MRRIACALIAVVLLGTPVVAAEAPKASHRQAAEEFLVVMNLEKAMMSGASTMVDAMIQGNASLGPYRDVILQWAGTFMTWETFGPKLTDMYADSFTESELREMTAFYRTPTGQKALALMPDMMRRGGMLGAEVARQHMPELERMVKERAAQLEKPASKP
jgi:uncharacterized protein